MASARGAHVGLRDDFEQWHTGAIEVHPCLAREDVMHRLPGVFLEMGTGNANPLRGAVIELDSDLAPPHDGKLVLTDLVSLGKVGIEVVLAGEDRTGRDVGVCCKAEHHGHSQHLPVEHRKHARKPQIDGAGLSVRFGAGNGRRAGEYLASSRELRVDLESDYRFPRHGPGPSQIRALG